MHPVPIPEGEQRLDDNAFLEGLNVLLEKHELEGYRDLEERYPTIHVMGLPRSGTTLALQLLVAHTDVAYIDHVAAAFWRAPATGLRLSESLRRHARRPSSYQSDYGRTADLAEPHEFSYFWARLLGTAFGLESLAEPADRSSVDWLFFKRVLTNMCEVVQGPIVFKSFHAIWRLRELCQTLPRTVVVVVRRDALAVAQSLLEMRHQLYGSREAWASVKPRAYSWLKDEDYATQIAGQIWYVNEAIADGIRHLRPEALVEVTYDDVCRDPAGFVAKVVDVVNRQGDNLRSLDAPRPFQPSSAMQERDPEVVRSLRDALARFPQIADAVSDASGTGR